MAKTRRLARCGKGVVKASHAAAGMAAANSARPSTLQRRVNRLPVAASAQTVQPAPSDAELQPEAEQEVVTEQEQEAKHTNFADDTRAGAPVLKLALDADTTAQLHPGMYAPPLLTAEKCQVTDLG